MALVAVEEMEVVEVAALVVVADLVLAVAADLEGAAVDLVVGELVAEVERAVA